MDVSDFMLKSLDLEDSYSENRMTVIFEKNLTNDSAYEETF